MTYWWHLFAALGFWERWRREGYCGGVGELQARRMLNGLFAAVALRDP